MREESVDFGLRKFHPVEKKRKEDERQKNSQLNFGTS